MFKYLIQDFVLSLLLFWIFTEKVEKVKPQCLLFRNSYRSFLESILIPFSLLLLNKYEGSYKGYVITLGIVSVLGYYYSG